MENECEKKKKIKKKSINFKETTSKNPSWGSQSTKAKSSASASPKPPNEDALKLMSVLWKIVFQSLHCENTKHSFV